MLQADVSQLLEHVGESQVIDMPYALTLEGNDYTVVSPVQLHLTLLSIGNGEVLLQGNVTGKLKATCGRCLTTFEQGFDVPVEEEYKKTEELMTATIEDRELGEEDFVYTIDAEGHIDLAEAIRQNIVVNLPLHFVCRETCPGIAQPNADEKNTDPRLAGLKNLKKN